MLKHEISPRTAPLIAEPRGLAAPQALHAHAESLRQALHRPRQLLVLLEGVQGFPHEFVEQALQSRDDRPEKLVDLRTEPLDLRDRPIGMIAVAHLRSFRVFGVG